ncbi:MAG TPA: hypothetical protein VLB67_07230 [Acidimicrobiia bacterium]|nr:hypothetical protein [Acidimicrobiia bacterium]
MVVDVVAAGARVVAVVLVVVVVDDVPEGRVVVVVGGAVVVVVDVATTVEVGAGSEVPSRADSSLVARVQAVAARAMRMKITVRRTRHSR